MPDVAVLSLDIGCVRVSERFLLHDPPAPEDLARARGAVKDQVVAARAGLPPLAPDSLLVGLAGTVSTLACLEHGITVYDRARVHHAVLSATPSSDGWGSSPRRTAAPAWRVRGWRWDERT